MTAVVLKDFRNQLAGRAYPELASLNMTTTGGYADIIRMYLHEIDAAMK